MPLQIIQGDINRMKFDATVNDTCDTFVRRMTRIFRRNERLDPCAAGEVKITRGEGLPSKYVINTVGPLYRNGKRGEKAVLASCYRNALAIAKAYQCETVALPLISADKGNFPKAEALKIAVDTIGGFLFENEMTVYIVISDRSTYKINKKLRSDITAFIDEKYVDLRAITRDALPMECFCDSDTPESRPMPYMATEELGARLKQIDESFSQMLLRKIDEKGMTDAECYKKANIDRKLFSKIRGDIYYRPSKPTAIAFAVSLELSLTETEDMLRKAGFALSHSNKFDIIIEYFISRGNYNIFEINEALFAFDQCLLGTCS